MTALRLLAPAKLNLVLRVVGRRGDGYHLLETLFHTIDCCDELTLRGRVDGPSVLSVAVDDPRDQVPSDGQNLVLRAAERFRSATGEALGFAFELHKRVPSGGGLGGGSSDAAAALRLCNTLCNNPLTAEQLHALAAGLGADVPFFLRAGPRWGTGVGDQLSTLVESPNYHFVLILPPFGCSTVEVYKNYSANWRPSFDAASVCGDRNDHPKDSLVRNRFDPNLQVNDLAAAAERIRPELGELRRRVVEQGVPNVHMTGSGSTLFVPAESQDEVDSILARLRGLESDCLRLLQARSLVGLPQVEPVSAGGGCGGR